MHRDVPAVFQQGGQRGRKHPPEGGTPPWKGHQVPVKATEGEISPLLVVFLVFLLHAIFLNHIRKNFFMFLNLFLLESNLYEFFLQQGCHSGEKER